MKKQILFVIILTTIVISCVPLQTASPIVQSVIPTDGFSRRNDFGDGYISHVSINDVNSETPEMIVKILVNQWLDHYKTGSTVEMATIEDFQVGEITLLERMNNDPSIVASVEFSIIPSQIPNDWASFPGDGITSEDSWWLLYAPVGVYQDKDYYWLKLMFGKGN